MNDILKKISTFDTIFKLFAISKIKTCFQKNQTNQNLLSGFWMLSGQLLEGTLFSFGYVCVMSIDLFIQLNGICISFLSSFKNGAYI